jgi:hypothetical protein
LIGTYSSGVWGGSSQPPLILEVLFPRLLLATRFVFLPGTVPVAESKVSLDSPVAALRLSILVVLPFWLAFTCFRAVCTLIAYYGSL